MNRPAFTVLFLLGATLFNLLAAALLFFLLLLLYSLSLGQFLALRSSAPVILGALVLAILGSGLIYRRVLALLRTRWDLDRKLGGKAF